MSNLSFTRQDIADLALKLTANQHPLTKPEQQLLLAIFEAAGHNVQRTPAAEAKPAAEAPVSGAVTAQELQQQLLRSFTPGTHSTEAQPLKIVGV